VKGEAVGRKGNRALCTFYLSKDPGYMETSKMLVEAGLCLVDNTNIPVGFIPPGGGLGDKLLDRLRKAGMQLETKGIPAGK